MTVLITKRQPDKRDASDCGQVIELRGSNCFVKHSGDQIKLQKWLVTVYPKKTKQHDEFNVCSLSFFPYLKTHDCPAGPADSHLFETKANLISGTIFGRTHVQWDHKYIQQRHYRWSCHYVIATTCVKTFLCGLHTCDELAFLGSMWSKAFQLVIIVTF